MSWMYTVFGYSLRLLALLISFSVNSQTTPPVCYEYIGNIGNSYYSSWVDSPTSAAQGALAKLVLTNSANPIPCGTGSYLRSYTLGTVNPTDFYIDRSSPTCDGFNVGPPVYTANWGYGTIQKRVKTCSTSGCLALENTSAGDAYVFQSSGPASNTVCKSSCTAVSQSSNNFCAGLSGTTTVACWIVDLKYTGGDCQPPSQPSGSTQAANPVTPAPQPGYCPGTVNGTTVYVRCASTTSTSTSTSYTPGTTTTGSGSGTSSSPTNATTTSTTNCQNGSCTTTSTTSSQPPGTTTPTTTTAVTTSTESDFCKLAINRDKPQCKGTNNSSFGGTCQTNFTCDGDAAICATARGVNESKCLLEVFQISDSSIVATGIQIAKGQGTTVNPKTTPDIINLGQFNKTNPFSSSCPADQSIAVMSTTILIPWSSACTPLQLMGYMLILVTTISCAAWFRN